MSVMCQECEKRYKARIEDLTIELGEYKIIADARQSQNERTDSLMRKNLELKKQIRTLQSWLDKIFDAENIQHGISPYLLTVFRDGLKESLADRP